MKTKGNILHLIASALPILVILLLVVSATVAFAAAPNVVLGTATVDGDYPEWDLTADFFADMYEAGKTNMDVLGQLYLRYDCPEDGGTPTLYALVLALDYPTHTIDVDAPGEEIHYIKIDNQMDVSDRDSPPDGVAPDFAWINPEVTPDGEIAEGWEASAQLLEGTYQINAHTDVDDAQTAAVAGRNIAIVLQCEDISAVTLASFAATPGLDNVRVAWETTAEYDNLGFNLYRAESVDGPRVQLNARLIPSAVPGSTLGATYEFVDESVVPGATYYYWLEDVDLYGLATLNGPVSAELFPMRRLLPARARPVAARPSLQSR